MRVGCYTLDLYCDKYANDGKPPHEYGEFPHRYTGLTPSKSAKHARAAGWLLGRLDLCPKCSGKPRKVS